MGLQGYKSKILSYRTKNHCSINLQNKSCTNYHIYCRKHQQFIKLGTSHNTKYPIQNCEKFSPIVKLNLALFSSVTAIIAPILLIALMLNVKRQQLTAHKSIVKGTTPKCYKHMSFFHHTLLCSLVLQTQSGASHKINIS